MRLSVTARIAMLTVALALFSNFAALLVVRQQVRAAAMETLRRETVSDADTLEAAGRGGAAALRDAVEEAADPDDPTFAVALFGRDGRKVYGLGPDRLSSTDPVRFRTGQLEDGAIWGYALRPVAADRLLVARRVDSIDAQQAGLERAMLVGVLVALVLGVAGGFVVSRYVARRLDRIGGVVGAVGEGDLSRRVDSRPDGDAFDRLAGRLNVALDRVERLMGELRLVTDGLAHDLRSPLGRLRSHAEQAALSVDGPARDAALGGLIAETDQVMRMLTMLVEISRSEQVSRDRLVAIDPADIVEEVADLYRPLLEDAERPLTVVAPPGAPVALHRELMSQALANLIDNALKHGAGVIALALERNAEGIAFSVTDRGNGIAPADRVAALRRFGRLDAARTVPGAGLGLSLIDAVARLHGGALVLADNAPGLVARIELPMRQPAEPSG